MDGPDEVNTKMYTPFEMGKIVGRIKRKLESLIGQFMHHGYNIWTTQKVPETYVIDSQHLGTPIQIKIDHEAEHLVNPSDINHPDRSQSQSMNHFLNIIIKQAMGSTGLLQFGQRPRFFDSKNPLEVESLNMQIWSGFKVSANRYSDCCTLVIDNCCRFMSTRSVLSRIQDIYDQMEEEQNPVDVAKFQQRCRAEIAGKSVIANYGNKKTYMVQDINFDLSPCSTFFTMQEGSKMSVAKYFKKEYGLIISDKRQPMLIMRQGGKGCFVPPEFCILDGVPDQIRNNNREMRELLSKTR
jgi:hypothetical protein